MNQFWGVDADPTAQGRIKGAKPVAVLDIGSNSVRLVVYERHARALTPLYNEKASCALGRGASTGRLADENVAQALVAIQRFALVARLMRVGKVHILATSAVRDAANRDDFVQTVESIMEARVEVLSGEQEAHFAALGVVSGIPDFTGIVGDQGGGSLELSRIENGVDAMGQTHELGVIRLQDNSGGSPIKAASIARAELKMSEVLARHTGGTFCAIGGTWRPLAKLHQVLRGYPLHMVQNYTAAADDLIELCEEIVASAGANGKSYRGADQVSSSRRELVPYGAAALSELLKAGRFEKVVFSALGVREGYLYGLLDRREQAVDPLIQAAEEMSVLRSRSPAHTDDLIAFTADFFQAMGIAESAEQERLRTVACLLSDIGWRGHPDYRGQQSVDAIAFSSLTGVDHPGRAFLAEVMATRYLGPKLKGLSTDLFALSETDDRTRARILGTLFRVAYPMSAAMPGILPRTRFLSEDEQLVLVLPADLVFLDAEHLRNRLDQLASAAGFKSASVRIA